MTFNKYKKIRLKSISYSTKRTHINVKIREKMKNKKIFYWNF